MLVGVRADVADPSEGEAWEEVVAACALCCAGLTVYLKERFEVYFLDSFKELLVSHYGTVDRAASVSFDEAEEQLRRHIVTGGLDIRVRKALFDEHRASLGVAADATAPES